MYYLLPYSQRFQIVCIIIMLCFYLLASMSEKFWGIESPQQALNVYLSPVMKSDSKVSPRVLEWWIGFSRPQISTIFFQKKSTNNNPKLHILSSGDMTIAR
jgi:hypothetical protein